MESMSYREKADEILGKLLEIKPESGMSLAEGLMLFYEELDQAGFFVDPEWEYGYEQNGYTEPQPVGRMPSEWLTTMGKPYRRRKQIEPGPWELADEDISIERDSRPWVRPGGHPEHHPQQNRTAHKEGLGWDFKPRSSYEQNIEKYGFMYAACGRTDTHWPHTTDKVPYCNGIAKQSHCP